MSTIAERAYHAGKAAFRADRFPVAVAQLEKSVAAYERDGTITCAAYAEALSLLALVRLRIGDNHKALPCAEK